MKISKFIYGTGNLNISAEKERINLLLEAIDCGFTHFDTSPLYNFGLSEKDLGVVLKINKYLTVTTKLGLYPPRFAKPNLIEVVFRKSFGKLIAPLSKTHVNYSLEIAKKSLDKSLRRLNRECIDILMIHEPNLELLNTEEWIKWFETLVLEGKIKFYGLAITRYLGSKNNFRIIQSQDDLFSKKLNLSNFDKPVFKINFGYFRNLKKKKFNSEEIIKKILDRNTRSAIIINTKDKNKLRNFKYYQKEIKILI